MDIRDWIGYSSGVQSWEYTWKDVALFGLASGAGRNELQYTYARRDDFRALPTFCLIPSFASNFVQPRTILNKVPGQVAQRALGGNGLDWDDELEIYRPLDAVKGTLVWDYVLEDIWDRGPGKGVVFCNVMNIYDEAGRKVAKNTNRTVMFQEGGFGGKPVPESEVVYPERAPDFEEEGFIDDTICMLYSIASLTISNQPYHFDEEFCRSQNIPDILVQGHLTMSKACRLLVRAAAGGDDRKVSKITCQFRKPVFPNTHILLQGWKVDAGKVYYRVVDKQTGVQYLSKGLFTFQEA